MKPIIPGNTLTLREVHGLLRRRLTVDGHPAHVARFAAGLIILGGVNEYDALVAAYRRAGALVVSKRQPSLAGHRREFRPIYRTPDWEALAPFRLADGTVVG